MIRQKSLSFMWFATKSMIQIW